MTSCKQRYNLYLSFVNKYPELITGSYTFDFVSAAFRRILLMHTKNWTNSIKTPVLLLSPTNETRVNPILNRKLCSNLPNCDIIDIEGARHELLMEKDFFRQQFWKHFDHFIDL